MVTWAFTFWPYVPIIFMAIFRAAAELQEVHELGVGKPGKEISHR
jgi:hypothetical protein